MTVDARPYRPGVGVLLLSADDRVFVAQRADTDSEYWQMPQGGIDPGEAPRAAARRELKEEIGTDRAVILAEHPDWLDYDLPPEFADRVWGGRYRGQTQKWFAMRFTGRDQDITLDTHHQPEFAAWRWAPIEALPGLVIPFKRRVYERVVTAFRPLVGTG
jgi:putative (di)nucleoside polyphosphate hydrolase